MNSMLSGRRGEAAAADFLRKKGYSILEANYKTRFGEIDLIAKDKGVLVFVEVKTRRDSNFAEAMEAVDRRKRKRIVLSAMKWLSEYDPNETLYSRFDIIEVYSESAQINHIENAFTAQR